MRARSAAIPSLLLAGLLLSGCTDPVVPAPTGQVDGGGGSVPVGMGNDVPVAGGGGSPVGGASGTSTAGRREAPVASSANSDASPRRPGVADSFYETAAAVGSNGPAGPPVVQDDRTAELIESLAADYPPLTEFDRSAAESLPAPDPKTPYASIVDPAEGESPADLAALELLTSGAEIDGVAFSSPAAAQAVVVSRVAGDTDRDHARLDRYDLAAGRAVSRADLPDRAELLDISPDGTRALVRLTFGITPDRRPSASQTRLDVWELTEEQGRHIVGWQPGAKDDGAPAVPLGAAFLDGDRVVTLTDDGTLTLWNLAEQKAVYTVTDCGNGPLLATPGRKYLAVFTGTTFGAFDAATGAFRGLFTPPRPTLAACREAAFSPDGAHLAAVLRRPAQSLLSWDVAAGRPTHEVDAPLGLGRGLHYGSPGYVVAGGVLFDLDRKKPVWLYVENSNSVNVGPSPDRRHWIVMQPAFKEPVLEAVAAPAEEVASASAGAANLTPPLLGPGESLSVRLDVEDFVGDRDAFDESLAQSLGRTFDERGLRLDGDAASTLVIEASERRTGESIRFNDVGIGGGEAVPAHQIDFTLSIVGAGERVLWTGTDRVPPSYVLAKEEGKTLEEVLLENLWKSAPAVIAAVLERSMPPYIRTAPPVALLGQTRLWAGADDVSPPGGGGLLASDTASPGTIDSVPVREPAMELNLVAAVRDVAVTPPPYGVLVATGDDHMARIFQPVPQAKSVKLIDEVRNKNGVTKLTLHPEGGRFFFGTERGEVRGYDLARRKPASGYGGADGVVTALTFTREPTLVAGTQGGRVYRWSESDHAAPTVIADGQAPVTALAPVPYANRVVVAWADGTAKLIDVGSGDVVKPLEVGAGPIHGVAVSPDASTAAFATETGGAVLVSLAAGKESARIDSGAVTAVAYKSDGVLLATANRLGHVVLWNVDEQQPDSRLEGAGGQVLSLVFSPDGTGLAAAVAGRKTVPVWDLSQESQRGTAGPEEAHGE